MRKQCVIGAIGASVVSIAQGMYEVETLRGGCVEAAFATPTNLVIKLNSLASGFYLETLETDTPLSVDGREILPAPSDVKRSRRLSGNETLVLTPDRKTILSERHSSWFFTPVLLKNKHKGFRVFVVNSDFGGWRTNDITYVALRETPVQVGAGDVKKLIVIPTSPDPDDLFWPYAQEMANETKIRAGVTQASQPNRLWLYVGISFCVLLAILYFIRRKSKN
ncbi:MAG: hypothetical protein FWH21_05835 [Kiritimatiellaeota bacterium]|nr:hypothetical protein [Kiritimatiellota bacterium]